MLSVCLIVRNEASRLRACVTSVLEVATQVVVVDTGSTDGTPELARDLGCEVTSHRWNHDFAAARNVSLDKASQPWILVLDADQCLDPDSAQRLPRILQSTQSSVLAFWDHFYLPRSSVQVYASMRLFRNDLGIRFDKAYGETIAHSLRTLHGKRPAPEAAELIVHHDQRGKDFGKRSEAIIRRLTALLSDSPADAHYLRYRGIHKMYMADFVGAYEDLSLAAKFRPAPRERYFLALSCIGLDRVAEAERLLVEVSVIAPQDIGVIGTLARLKAQSGDFNSAIELWHKMLQLAPVVRLARSNLLTLGSGWKPQPFDPQRNPFDVFSILLPRGRFQTFGQVRD